VTPPAVVPAVVVDASVAVAWAVPEPHSAAALGLLEAETRLLAPAHWLGEAATALWAQSAVHNLLTRAQAEARIAWLAELEVREAPLAPLLPAAARWAFELRLTVDDTLYLALAEREAVPLVTADRRLHAAAQAEPRAAPLVTWMGAG
jgi:predicted nucleic acid-binding protein